MFQIASFKIICTDSTEIFFSKIGSAGLNYYLAKKHLPKLSFFTDSYCAGVSNKHCLLTFCIIPVLNGVSTQLKSSGLVAHENSTFRNLALAVSGPFMA